MDTKSEVSQDDATRKDLFYKTNILFIETRHKMNSESGSLTV